MHLILEFHINKFTDICALKKINLQMDATNDLKKYFNSKEYATTIIGNTDGGVSAPVTSEDKISSLISLLTDPANK